MSAKCITPPKLKRNPETKERKKKERMLYIGIMINGQPINGILVWGHTGQKLNQDFSTKDGRKGKDI